MDQFIMAGLFGAIVIIVCYTTIQVMEIVDKRKYNDCIQGLTPGEIDMSDQIIPRRHLLGYQASEDLSRYIANEELRRFGEATNRFGINMGRNILDRPHRPSRPPEPPSHYTQGDIEVIDYIEDKKLGYRLGNVVKYVSRAGHKDDAIKDLKKASWYLNREIVKREEHDKSRASTN